jgi:hypothetical protein
MPPSEGWCKVVVAAWTESNRFASSIGDIEQWHRVPDINM